MSTPSVHKIKPKKGKPKMAPTYSQEESKTDIESVVSELCSKYDSMTISTNKVNTTKDNIWKHILEYINYANEDSCVIMADDIKDAKSTWKGSKNQFEPRLLCYITSASDRPKIFIENGLSMLPVDNGKYILIKQNIYFTLSYITTPPIEITRDTSSLLLTIGQSETTTIDNMRYSRIFERDEILGETITHDPLLNGRHRTPAFSFNIGQYEIDVKGVQYEIDACYETANKILIIEGKSSNKQIDSFNIRQLYYPYRTLSDIVGDKKQIICGFIHNLNGIIHVWLFTFTDKMRMDSIKQIGTYTYTFT